MMMNTSDTTQALIDYLDRVPPGQEFTGSQAARHVAEALGRELTPFEDRRVAQVIGRRVLSRQSRIVRTGHSSRSNTFRVLHESENLRQAKAAQPRMKRSMKSTAARKVEPQPLKFTAHQARLTFVLEANTVGRRGDILEVVGELDGKLAIRTEKGRTFLVQALVEIPS